MKFGQLHHVEYYVDDLAASNEFWDWFMKEMDYKVYQKFGGGISWVHETGTYLVFVQAEAAHLNAKNNRHGSGLNQIAFCGKSLEHLQELEKNLRSKGVQIIKSDKMHICFADPNQFAVEVFLPEA